MKPWKEAGALNAHLNLYGFWRQGAFLTKSGDVGMVMRVRGVDYESLDQAAQEYAVKRLEAAFKTSGFGFHVYQYLFKTNRPDIPFADYDDPVVQAAVDQRKEFFAAKLDHIYQIEIFYVVVLEGARSKTGIMPAFAQLPTSREDYEELNAPVLEQQAENLLRSQIEIDYAKLDQRVQSFVRQLADAVEIEVLGAERVFHLPATPCELRPVAHRGPPKSSAVSRLPGGQLRDRGRARPSSRRQPLRQGSLTMREAIAETRPLVLKALLDIPANFIAVSEWVLLETRAPAKK